MQVLVATGNEQTDMRVSEIVGQLGREVLIAADGEQALELAHLYHPTVAILGERLQKQSCWLVCAKLKVGGYRRSIVLHCLKDSAAIREFARFVGADALLGPEVSEVLWREMLTANRLTRADSLVNV